jgi:hypothetical protein
MFELGASRMVQRLRYVILSTVDTGGGCWTGGVGDVTAVR